MRLPRMRYNWRPSRSMRIIASPPLSPAPARLFERLCSHPPSRPAVTHGARRETYGELLAGSARIAAALRAENFEPSLGAPPRIGLLHAPGHAWAHALLGMWRAGLVAVPLSPAYPPRALGPLLSDAAVSAVLADPALAASVPPGVRVLPPPDGASAASPGDLRDECDTADARMRMLLYTSGTTGAPKGVVWTEGMLRAQLGVLHKEWRWEEADRALCVLPLHHVHGVVNVALGALYAGAELEFHDRFSAERVWDTLRSPRAPSVFMAVPTVYARLLERFHAASACEQDAMQAAARRLRLFVCGSAALPRQHARAWARIAGAPPLERYGMTETGMLLSNPYEEAGRVEAALGSPLPGVSARVEGADGSELRVKGPGVFGAYWRKERATRDAFDDEGWFRTGDVVRFDEAQGVFRMLGRASTDIIKSGGYKVSALEIEGAVRDVAGVRDVAVVGVPHAELGEGIVAVVVVKEEGTEEVVRANLMTELREVLPRYKIPRAVHFVEKFARNVMGKVKKSELKKEWGNWYQQKGWEGKFVGG